ATPLFAQDSLETAKRHELEDLNRQAREKRAAAAQLKGQESKALVRLRRTEKELTTTRRRLRSLENRSRNLDVQLEVTRADLSHQLAVHVRRRLAESEKAKSEGRNPQPYTGDFARGRGALDWPATGSVVGRFGPETHPKWGTTTMNNGIDIQAPMGAAVHAVA